MLLERLDQTSFQALVSQWRESFGGDDDLLYEHCRPHLDHALKIVSEAPSDPGYGIYALVARRDEQTVYEGFTHVNHAKPRREVRLVWNTLHPRYEVSLDPLNLAEITYAYIAGAIALANGDMEADAVRIYLHNATDRRYAQGIVAGMRHSVRHANGVSPTIDMAGNWLHLQDIRGLSL